MSEKSIIYRAIFSFSLLMLIPNLMVAEGLSMAESSDKKDSQAPQNVSSAKNLQAAATVASFWTNLLDKEKYDESWETASVLMKFTIKKDEWLQVLEKMRKPLGGLISRQVLDQRTAKNPHGMPKGDYMVLFYKTSFAHKPAAYELVTLFLEDGEWKVVTYQVD